MNKKSKYMFLTVCFIGLLMFLELLYIQKNKVYNKKNIEDKKILVSVLQLPDLAISTEAMFIRHRTLNDTFATFKEGPELKEYFPTTYIYSHSHILNNTPSKILNEK